MNIPSSLTLRVAAWVAHGGGVALLALFYVQQLSLVTGVSLLIAGFSFWNYWLVFIGLLSLRGSFFLQTIYRQIGSLPG